MSWEHLAGRGPRVWERERESRYRQTLWLWAAFWKPCFPSRDSISTLLKYNKMEHPQITPDRFLLCILFLNSSLHFLVISEGFGKWWKCRRRQWRRGFRRGYSQEKEQDQRTGKLGCLKGGERPWRPRPCQTLLPSFKVPLQRERGPIHGFPCRTLREENSRRALIPSDSLQDFRAGKREKRQRLPRGDGEGLGGLEVGSGWGWMTRKMWQLSRLLGHKRSLKVSCPWGCPRMTGLGYPLWHVLH